MTDGGVQFVLDGRDVWVADDRTTLLDALREHLGVRSVKDGCSPQGQCGCCTVLVDGSPRVACVTPVSRVRGKSITTVDGLDDADRWADAFCATGASQCGFCTPGIIVRLSALSPESLADRAAVDKALLAHLCRCTGWQPIRDAARIMGGDPSAEGPTDRDFVRAARRAEIEGGVAQHVDPAVALGRGGFADDTAPSVALVALRRSDRRHTDSDDSDADDGGDTDAQWVVGETLANARQRSEKIQGRRTTAPASWPVDVPSGRWSQTLQTTWVEPAYLEPDASWCPPGGEPLSSVGNGGAFGAKLGDEVGTAARDLAARHDRPVRTIWAREDVVRLGAKRPPLALAVAPHGAIAVRFVSPDRPELGEALRQSIVDAVGESGVGGDAELDVEAVECAGPTVSPDLRGAGWAEVVGAVAAWRADPNESVVVSTLSGARATVQIGRDGRVDVTVDAGPVLDEVVLRSYCIGAVHQALGMVRSESISLDDEGRPLDLTIRSFGVLRAVDMPDVVVSLVDSGRCTEPVNGSDAVFAATFGAAWRDAGFPERLPISAV
ncbi:MAG: 2Fe-2S iron-sulfur cluster-binding protein [Actinomycetota bacterium]